MIVFVCFAAVLAVSSAGCPVYKAQNPFSIANFTGTWYRQFSMYTPYYDGSCITSTYTMDEITGELHSYSTRKDSSGQFEKEYGALGRTNTSSTDGKLTIRTRTSEDDEVTLDITVLSTDYTNYAILYSCYGDDSSDITESNWVMTRARKLNYKLRQTITDAVKDVIRNGGPSNFLYVASQANCS